MKSIGDYLPVSANAKAGKSPSFTASIKGIFGNVLFQIKRSNSVRFLRRLIGYDKDISDILGEYIASNIAKGITDTNVGISGAKDVPEVCPEVSLITDPSGKIAISSRFLNSGVENAAKKYDVMSFDDVLFKQNPELKAKGIRHCYVDLSRTDNDLSLKPNKSLDKLEEMRKAASLPINQPIHIFEGQEQKQLFIDKKQYYNFLRMSFVLGDHDINPGNFFLIHDNQQNKDYVGRIDWGHAFCDLIKKWFVGNNKPSIKKGTGVVLDAINRSSINGAGSKFDKYMNTNMIQDDAFIDMMRSNEYGIINLHETIRECKDNLMKLIHKGEKFKKQVVEGLISLNNKMNCSLPRSVKNDPYDVIEIVLDNCSKFVEKNYMEAVSVGNLLKIQKDINKLVLAHQNQPHVREDALKNMVSSILDTMKNDNVYLKGISNNINLFYQQKVNWVNIDRRKKVEECSVMEYISRVFKENGLERFTKDVQRGIHQTLEVLDARDRYVQNAFNKDHSRNKVTIVKLQKGEKIRRDNKDVDVLKHYHDVNNNIKEIIKSKTKEIRAYVDKIKKVGDGGVNDKDRKR